MTPPDPLLQLEHDHTDITRLVLALRQHVEAAARENGSADHRALRECLTQLRDQLIFHFAREEEGLFPFIRERAPRMRDRVAALEAAHDSVCGGVVRMAALAAGHGPIPRDRFEHLCAIFARFEPAYATHSQNEQALLRELGEQLDGPRRAELAELLRGL